MTDIGSAIASAEQQMKMVKEVKADPDLALEYAAKYPALVYYDSKVKHPVVNTMAEKALAYQIAFLRGLRKDNKKPQPKQQKQPNKNRNPCGHGIYILLMPPVA